MILTRLEELGKRRCKVYIDGAYTFPLYIKDIAAAKLKEGMELSRNDLNKLIEDYVFPSAQQKALSLLKFMDRTQKELEDRLAHELYPEYIIERTIEYVSQYGYINDERYADTFVSFRKHKKSWIIIKSELHKKGINSEILDRIFLSQYNDEDEDPEIIAIKKAVAKKTRDLDSMTSEEKEKLTAHLYRKGFRLDNIKLILGK